VPKLLRLRVLTDEEHQMLARLIHSRTDPVRAVERARIVWEAPSGAHVPAIARRLRLCEATVRLWLTRFNTQGFVGLGDAPRIGRPPTDTAEETSEVIAASLTDPEELDLPFGSWTLDRLTVSRHETRGLTMSRSRIGEMLQAEGLRWRTQETWFGERVDPDFVAKRGQLVRALRRHLREVSSCAWTRWDRNRQKATLVRG